MDEDTGEVVDSAADVAETTYTAFAGTRRADLKHSAMAHLPSGSLTANSAWLALAALAHNLTRALATSPVTACTTPPPPPSARR